MAERAHTDRLLRGERTRADTALEASHARRRAARRGFLIGEALKDTRPGCGPPVGAEALQHDAAVAFRDANETALDRERERTDAVLATERASADSQLAARNDFMGMVIHDLRGLVGMIDLNANLLAASERNARATTCPVDNIQILTSRAFHIIDDLADVVRVNAGRLSIVPAPHDAVGLLQKIFALFDPVKRDRSLHFALESSAATMPGWFDFGRISQVVMNLVGNAIKFTPVHGHIGMSVRRSGQEMLFAVADDGCGIDPDKLELIFERFWQPPRAMRVGLGLGLYISRHIVEAHGGRIWADSAPGVGTTFHFSLPIGEADR